jgi:hypothetical protein
MEENTRKCYEERQFHVHELLGSVKVVPEEDDEEFHNHRFAAVSGPAIPIEGRHHVHEIKTRTDFYEDHFHEICVCSEPETPVCNGKHVHCVRGTTTENEGHQHDFILATLIEDPIGD